MLKMVLVLAFLFGWTASPGSAHGQSSGAAASGARPAYDSSAPADLPKVPTEIHVDQRCRILPDPNQPVAPGAKPPHARHDGVICHLEGVLHSEHVEETTISGKQHQFLVSVEEQEYVLQNVTSGPAIFIVEQLVRPDWAIDSDPPAIQMLPAPAGTSGQIALFRANAEPHQIVRLHVGMRHSWLKKPKQAGNPPPSQTNAPPPAPPQAQAIPDDASHDIFTRWASTMPLPASLLESGNGYAAVYRSAPESPCLKSPRRIQL